MNLINAIANSVNLPKGFLSNDVRLTKSQPTFHAKQRGRSDSKRNDTQPKPILQLNPLPITIEPSQYQNAKSNSNPNGDLKPLFALRQLVDPVPKFEHDYVASSYSTEMLYASILNGATIVNNEPFTSSVIGNAKSSFAENALQDMDGTPGNWRPIYAIPEDWASADISRFKEVSIDFDNTTKNSAFDTIQGQDQLFWTLGNNQTQSLNAKSKIKSVKMKYLFVAFRRPWFDLLLFKMGNWFIQGQQSGFCSSGTTKLNNGILPLLPTGMLIAKDIVVDADWHADDQAIVDQLAATGKTGCLGPFNLSRAKTSNSSLQVIGWVSEVVPFSPSGNEPANNQ